MGNLTAIVDRFLNRLSGIDHHGGLGNLPGRGHQRSTTRPTTWAAPYARESSLVSALSLTTHQPSRYGRTARFTTSRSGPSGNRATTTSPARTGRPPRRTSSTSPCRRVGAMDGPCTCTTNTSTHPSPHHRARSGGTAAGAGSASPRGAALHLRQAATRLPPRFAGWALHTP